MNETQLQIIISAVNNAQSALSQVSEQLGALSEDASEAAEQIDTAFSDTGSAIATDLATGTAAAATAVDGLSDTITADAAEMDTAFSGLNQKLLSIGIQAGLVGAAIAAPAEQAVSAAASQKEAFDQLSNTVENVYAGVGTAATGSATEIAKLNAEIATQQAAIASANAEMQDYSGTTAEVAARHEKAAAAIATAESNIQKYQQELDNLTNSQSLAGSSAAATTAQFEAAARASTNLGFTTTESATALTYLFSATQNVNETMAAYQDSMDVAAKLGIPLSQAANDVVQAMNGQGRALRDLGVNVADGLSGQTALAAIQEKVAGSAQEAATQGLGPMSVAQAKLNETLADMGTTVLPALNTFFTDVTKIITAVDAWSAAHPKLTEAILIFIGVLGGLLIFLGAVLIILSPIIIAIAAFGAAFVFWFVAVGVALAALAALFITNWDAIKTGVSNATSSISSTLQAWGTTLSTWWSGLWSGIYNFLAEIWGKIQAVITSVLAAISKVTGGISSVFGGVTSGVTTLLGDVKAFASGGIVNSPTLALVGEAGPEAIIPLSAFDGGASLSGSGIGGAGNIVININGGSYLNQGGAQQIAQALATMIGQQLKLKIR